MDSAEDSLISKVLLDTYEVDRVLAEGGMGRIYQAHHTRIKEKRFAIKVLRPEYVRSPQIRARFEREMQAIARVSHPGVLAIVDVGATAHGSSFMVSEYLNGLDLLAYLRRFGALQNDRVVELGRRIAEALEATHAQGVIHRDVKPSNVFLLGAFEPLGPEWDGVKLIDFGLSRFENRDDELSKAGIVMGTPAYMAPEQARGGRTDHLTDVYGVGAVLYAAATGKPPFREETQQENLMAAMNRDPVRPRDVNPAISEGLEIIIQRAMSKQPEQRHPSMSALRLALSELEQRAERPTYRGPATRPSAAAGRGVRTSYVALALATLLLVVMAAANAAAGLMALAAREFTSTREERVLLVVTLSMFVGLITFWLLRMGRSVWHDSSKLHNRLPRLQAPLAAGLLIYGVGSLVLRFGHEVIPNTALDAAVVGLPDVAWPGWTVLLSLGAFFSAAVVATHQHYWLRMSARQRTVWGLLGAAVIAAVVLTVARYDDIEQLALRARLSEMSRRVGNPPSSTVTDPNDVSAGTPAATVAGDPRAPAASGADGGASDAGASPAQQMPILALRPAPSPPPAAAPAPPSVNPEPPAGATPASSTLPIVHRDEPVNTDPDSPDALRARAHEQAERASEMLDAVHTVERLLSVSPDKVNDPVVRDILGRAAATDGDASKAAFRLMGNDLGTRGPELMYDLMLERPILAEKAKYQLSRYRVRRWFSPALSVAYDLRLASTCAGRLSMLDRANEFGDQRSVDTLSALLGKPERCGPGEPVACLPLCTREAVQFTRSIEIITHRLRASQREAAN